MPAKDKEFFCIEGTHLLEELLKSGIDPASIIATDTWQRKNSSLISNFDNTLISTVTIEALTSAVSAKTPDGVAALVKKSYLSDFSVSKKDDFILVLDRIQDPGNLGNLFRTALAGGVNKVLIGGGANPLAPKVLRASCGSIFKIPFLRIEGDDEKVVSKILIYLKNFQQNGFQIVSTSSQSRASKTLLKPYWELNWLKPTVLILGNEGTGIHNKIQEAFNETITIPHNELVESLNVACVAVPLLLERKRVALIKNTKI